MNVGFIGVGTITEAVVKGLCGAGARGLSILLSPRNRERSRNLSERHAAVEVAAFNASIGLSPPSTMTSSSRTMLPWRMGSPPPASVPAAIFTPAAMHRW